MNSLILQFGYIKLFVNITVQFNIYRNLIYGIYLIKCIVTQIGLMPLYRVFTGNCGKVTYYISRSISHKFLNFLYLDYHRWTYITTNFQ